MPKSYSPSGQAMKMPDLSRVNTYLTVGTESESVYVAQPVSRDHGHHLQIEDSELPPDEKEPLLRSHQHHHKPNLTESSRNHVAPREDRLMSSFGETMFSTHSVSQSHEAGYYGTTDPLAYRALAKVGCGSLYGKRNALKIAVFSLFGIVAAFCFMVPEKAELEKRLFSIPPRGNLTRDITDEVQGYFRLDFEMLGYENKLDPDSSLDPSKPTITVSLCTVDGGPAADPSACYGTERFVWSAESLTVSEWRVELRETKGTVLLVQSNGTEEHIALALGFERVSSFAKLEIVVAGLIMVLLYALIISEVIHRTVAAMLASTLALGSLTLMNKGPELETVIGWIEWETLMLLFGMMILVAIFAESGFFDYISLMAYKVSKGRQWPMIILLCTLAGGISAFLDNVTTILLMTPVTINLCEVLDMDAKWVLIAEVILSNIGGTATAIGDPPNVLLVSDADLKESGIDFVSFTLHLCWGSLIASVVGMGCVKLLYRNKNLYLQDDPEIRHLIKELKMWKRTMNRISTVSREEKVVKAMLLDHIRNLQNHINEEKMKKHEKRNDWMANYEELKQTYTIKDFNLLYKSGIVLIVVVLMFFLQSSPALHTDLGWIAIMAAIVLLLLADLEDIEEVLHKVEWSTLVFFAALFVLMAALTEMGLLDFIGGLTQDLIEMFPEDLQFPFALIIILWVSALASAFIDNIPFTEAMIPVIIDLANSSDKLHLEPLVFALAFGACLGGNGTLIGASANVVCAGIAETKGYKITFGDFFSVGFPVMLATVFVAMIYLTFCHIIFAWGNQ